MKLQGQVDIAVDAVAVVWPGRNRRADDLGAVQRQLCLLALRGGGEGHRAVAQHVGFVGFRDAHAADPQVVAGRFDDHTLEAAAVAAQIVRAVPRLRVLGIIRLRVDPNVGIGVAGEIGFIVKRAGLPGGHNRAAVDGGAVFDSIAKRRFSGLSNQGAALHGEGQGIYSRASLRRLSGGYPERAAAHGHNKCIDAAA